jgi:SH3 domain protein
MRTVIDKAHHGQTCERVKWSPPIASSAWAARGHRRAGPTPRLTAAKRLLPLLLASLTALASAAYAQSSGETQYVTDQYDFNLRSGESTKYKIIRTLPSGTPLEILSVNKTTGYAHVRADDGKTGYILIRYLQPEPAARAQLATMRSRLEELQQAPDALAARLDKLQQAHDELTAKHDRLQRTKEKLEQELAEVRHASANAIRINEERQRLQDQVAELVLQVDNLEHQTMELSNRRDQHWFLIGAGVIVGGIVIGLILPNLRLRPRRRSWGSL